MMALMQTLEFAKGHGTGNDFVIVPDPGGERVLSPELVAALCDRRFGVGGDGLLRVVRTAAQPEVAGGGDAGWSGAEWFMDYRNADGSVAEMCGNGVRVFARYLVESGLAPAGEIIVATRTGPVVATVTGESVTVALPRPRIDGPGRARIGGHELAGTVVDCGNPHLVCTLPEESDLAGFDLAAPPWVDPARFPAGTNVELVEPVTDRLVRMRVHERGVGETLSCGSGACAAAVVTLRRSGLDRGSVEVDLPGGRLAIELTATACRLTGPAVLVASGQVMLGGVTARGGPEACSVTSGNARRLR
jgi:diaminopimelate epimerase